MLKEKLESAENVLQANAALKQECEKAHQRVETERKCLEEERRLRKISVQEGKSLKEELSRALERIVKVEHDEKEDRMEIKRLQEEVKESVDLVRVVVKHLESAQCSFQLFEENLSAKVSDVSAQSLKSYSLAQSVLSTASSAQTAARKAEATVISVQKQTQTVSSRLGNLQKQGTRLEQSVTFLRQQLQKNPPINQDGAHETFKGPVPSTVLSTQHSGVIANKGMVLSKNQRGNDESSNVADRKLTNRSLIEVIPGISSILNPVLSKSVRKPSVNGSHKPSMLSSESNVLDLECSSKWDMVKSDAQTKGMQDSCKHSSDLKEANPSNEHNRQKTNVTCCQEVFGLDAKQGGRPIETIATNQNLADVRQKEVRSSPCLTNQASPITLLGSLSRLFKRERKAQHKIKANLANLKKALLSCPTEMCLDGQHQHSSEPISYTIRKRRATDATEKQDHEGIFVVEGRQQDKKRRKETLKIIPDDNRGSELFQNGLEEKSIEPNIPKQEARELEDEGRIDGSTKLLKNVKMNIEEWELQHKKEVRSIVKDIKELGRTSEHYKGLHNLVIRRQKDDVEAEATESEGNGDVLFAECNENQATGACFSPSDSCCNLFEYRASDWEMDSIDSEGEFAEKWLADMPVLLSPDLPIITPQDAGMVLSHSAGRFEDSNLESDEDLR
ncbi:hypothetical protein O6H91_01G145300 [Diphasiastrum complanatum]|nr:hypothetical protein O6H91_01G145300 [Diphasiastrum complanatum]